MEGYSLGAILASIVAGAVLVVLGVTFTRKKKTSLTIKDSSIGGDVKQDVSDTDNSSDTEQVLDLDNAEVRGSLAQTNSDKKKQ